MSEKLIFTNSQGLSVELGNEGPFILTKIEGTGAVTADIQTQKSPFQDGMTYIDNTLEPRLLAIEIMILADSEEAMTRRRRKLLQVFNPKLGPGRLIYEFGGSIKEIEAVPELAPVFPDARPFEDTMQPGLISLYCPTPFWLEQFEQSQEIAAWIGGLKFPLRFPTTFAMKGPGQKTVINNGDVETPVRIEFIGPAANPRITNTTTGEYIQVNRRLEPGERLIITTDFGNKRIKINGQNVLHWIDLKSVFWQLQPGDNIVDYSSDDQMEPASVVISYKNRYVGI